MTRRLRLVVSCEHAGHDIPPKYRSLFRSRAAQRSLVSHRGWDPGSLTLGRRLAGAFDAPLVVNRHSRLLVEVNRSIGHPGLFSEFSKGLQTSERDRLLKTIYANHRDRVEQNVSSVIAAGACAVHIGTHSFVPQLNGDTRNADVGLLYDPQRRYERSFCTRWQAILRQLVPQMRVRRNYPYLGKADGLTTYLRRGFRPSAYLGIELEVNQRLLSPSNRRAWIELQSALVESLRLAMGTKRPPSLGTVVRAD